MRKLHAMALLAIITASAPVAAAETRLGPAPPQQQGQPMQLAELEPSQCAAAVANAKAAKLPLPSPEYLAWASIATQAAWCPEFAVWLKENQTHFIAAPPGIIKPPKPLVLGPQGPFWTNRVVELGPMTIQACDQAVVIAVKADAVPPAVMAYAKAAAREGIALCTPLLDWATDEDGPVKKTD